MSASPSGEFSPVTMPVADIVPYWRNPRRISDEAVQAVMDSIKLYGYQQPIVVDTERVIIMGHTRHAAVRRLGLEAVPVLVATNLTPKQVKELRTIDNRTAEFTRWDFEKLLGELGTMDQSLMYAFFPEAVSDVAAEVASGESLLEEQIIEVVAPREDPVAEFVCPNCFHGWEMPVSREDVLAGHLYAPKAPETEGASA